MKFLLFFLNLLLPLVFSYLKRHTDGKELSSTMTSEESEFMGFLQGIKDSRQRKLELKRYLDRKANILSQEESFFSSKNDTVAVDSQTNTTSNAKTDKNKQYTPFEYYDYDGVVDSFKKFAKDHPNLIKLTTAQELYGLPSPAGDCGNKPCLNYIAFIGNQSVFNKETPQIYISCDVHGDERIGPTLCVEFVNLLLSNQNDPWISYLLSNRYIIMTPMTNAYGYYMSNREEIVDIASSASFDPNRDFPILKSSNECMNTITGRTMNEIFINNLIRLSLSIHGGTSSLTYAYGTPNHLTKLPNEFRTPINPDNFDPKTDTNLIKVNNELLTKANQLFDTYSKGTLDRVQYNIANDSPDEVGLRAVAEAMSRISNSNPNFQYPTGKMDDLVYPVRGGFEDWAYSASWEGFPTTSPPCTSKTYNGYSLQKTNYKEHYPNALKALSYLLETADEKNPPSYQLGVNRKDCLFDIIRQPFDTNVDKNKEDICLSNTYNGYITKNIRLLFILLDFVQPYLNVNKETIGKSPKTYNKTLTVEWIVGGSKKVDETFILYEFEVELPKRIKQNEDDLDNFSAEVAKNDTNVTEEQNEKNNNLKTNANDSKLQINQNNEKKGNLNILNKKFLKENIDSQKAMRFKGQEPSFIDQIESLQDEGFKSYSESSNIGTKTQTLSGSGIWDDRSNNINFTQEIEIPNNAIAIKYIILAKVDQSWYKIPTADPQISARTHLINERTNPTYYAENNGYIVKGKSYFDSGIKRVKLN